MNAITMQQSQAIKRVESLSAEEEIALWIFERDFTPDDLFQNIGHDEEEEILKALADGDELEAGHILARIRKQVIYRYASQRCYGDSTTLKPEDV